jgi:hypothetical protein
MGSTVRKGANTADNDCQAGYLRISPAAELVGLDGWVVLSVLATD